MGAIFSDSFVYKITTFIEGTLDQLDRVNSPLIRDSLFYSTRTIFLGLASCYHGAQYGIRSVPVAIKLLLNQIPLDVARILGNGIWQPSTKQSEIHATCAKQSISSLFTPALASSSRSKQLKSSIVKVAPAILPPSMFRKIIRDSGGPRNLALGTGLAIATVFGLLNAYSLTSTIGGLAIYNKKHPIFMSAYSLTPTVARSAVYNNEHNLTFAWLDLSVLLGALSTGLLLKIIADSKRIKELKAKAIPTEPNFNKVIEYDNEIRELTETNSLLQTQLSDSIKKNNALNNYINNLQDNYQHINNQYVESSNQLQQLTGKYNELLLSQQNGTQPTDSVKMSDPQLDFALEVCQKLGLKCPLSLDFFDNPTTLINGQTYSKKHIDLYFEKCDKDPNTRDTIPKKSPRTPNHIVAFLVNQVLLRTAGMVNPGKVDVDSFITQLHPIEIEDPVLIIKSLSIDYPVGMTVPKEVALEILGTTLAEEKFEDCFVSNLALKGYNDHIKAPADEKIEKNNFNNIAKDNEEIRIKRLQHFEQ